jgi:hypothetical protein
MNWNQLWVVLNPTLKVISEQLPGLVISLATSFYVSQIYFNRQRKIDKEKEEKEVQLYHRKLMNAYITSLGKRPKVASFPVREAMDDLKTRLEIYRPDFDANKWLSDLATDAVKFIAEHRDDFEDIPKENLPK